MNSKLNIYIYMRYAKEICLRRLVQYCCCQEMFLSLAWQEEYKEALAAFKNSEGWKKRPGNLDGYGPWYILPSSVESICTINIFISLINLK